MVLTKDGKALTANGKLLKGNVGLVKVNELPENPQENIIYESEEYTDFNVFIVDNYVPTTIFTLEEIIAAQTFFYHLFYYVVDELPDTPLESDVVNLTPVHIYIYNDIPYIYGNVGYGNMWISVSQVFNALNPDFAYIDKGYTQSIDIFEVPTTNDQYVYVTYKKRAGINSKRGGLAVLRDGKYIDYETIFYKTITKLDSNMKVIPKDAFYDCKKLTEVILPKVVTIDGCAFCNCNFLEYVDLRGEDRPIFFEYNAFDGCASLFDIYTNNSRIIELDTISVFDGTTNNLTIHVRPELVEEYQTATNWSILIADERIKIVGDIND